MAKGNDNLYIHGGKIHVQRLRKRLFLSLYQLKSHRYKPTEPAINLNKSRRITNVT